MPSARSIVSLIAVSLVLSSCAAAPALKTEEAANTIALGKPCDVRGDTTIETNGMQCFWTGENERNGFWIVPELTHRGGFTNFPYGPFTASWKQYRAPDGSFTLQYPLIGSVGGENWKELGRIEVFIDDEGDLNQAVIVEKVDTNAVTMEDRIKDIEKSAGKVQRYDAELNGMPIIRLDVAQKDNLSPGFVAVFIPREGYYLHVSAPHADSTYSDFLREGIMSTIEVK